MGRVNLLPADTYIVVNKTILNDQDRRILTMLYQPIVGSDAINLYYTLWSYLDKSEIISCEWTHHHLMASMRMKLEVILEAREKLEAIGLLTSLVKKGSVDNYIYELYSPISAYDFFNNPILSVALQNNIGQTEYEKAVAYFSIPKLKTEDYEDITCLFNDVFEPVVTSQMEHIIEDIKRRNKKDLQLNCKIDLNEVIALIPEDLLNPRSVTRETKELIYKLSFIYSLDNDNTVEIIKNSVDDRKVIDKELLKSNCRNYFKFENGGKLPSLAYKNQPEYLRKNLNDTSKKAKMIYTFETTSPSEFLGSKNSNGVITQTDKDILTYLLVELNLNPGVVNVLIDYILKINNNKLNKPFVEAIAIQWSRSNITTVEGAMNLAEKEYKNRNNIKKTNIQYKKRIVEDRPDWFDKEVEVKTPSDSRKKELEEILKEYK
jgi:replication initiation and membrane attachment protein